MESTTEEAPVAEGIPEKAWRLKEKATETESRSSLSTDFTCTVSGRSIPGKIWMPTNQFRAIPLTHTHTANYERVHFRHLGVYKESRVATEPFGLGLAKV